MTTPKAIEKPALISQSTVCISGILAALVKHSQTWVKKTLKKRCKVRTQLAAEYLKTW